MPSVDTVPPGAARRAIARPNLAVVSAALRGFFMHEECDTAGCHLFPNCQRLVEEQLYAVFEARLLDETTEADLNERAAFDWICKMAWATLQVRGHDGRPWKPKTIANAVGVAKSLSPRLTREHARLLDDWAERLPPMRARALADAEREALEQIRAPLRIVATSVAQLPDAEFGARTLDLARRMAATDEDGAVPPAARGELDGIVSALGAAMEQLSGERGTQ